MLCVLPILGLVLLAAGGARADTPDITLGPAVLTFPEIARQLNAQGQHVLYDSRLRDRAAYIYLKQRSWADTRNLLSESLEIRFRQKQGDPSTWIMESDPTVQAREDRWLQDYATNIHFLLHRTLQPILPYMNVSYAAVCNEWESLGKQLKAADKDGSLRDPGQAERFFSLAMQRHNLRIATDAGNWIAAHLLKAGLLGDPMDSLQGKFTVGMARLNSLVDETSLAAMKATGNISGKAQIDSNCLLVYGWDFNAEEEIPSASLQFITPDGEVAVTEFGTDHYPAAGQIFDGILPPASFYPGLSEEAQKWLLARRAETRAFLNTDIAKKRFTLRSAIGAQEVTSISQLIESWSRELNAEAIMELWPVRESFDSLAVPLRMEASSSGNFTNLAQEFVDPQVQPGAFDDRAGAWTLHEQSGVLLVTNRLAFLDRYRRLALTPFLKMQAKMLARQDQRLDYQTLSDFCQQTDSAQYNVWRLVGQYRGIGIREIQDYPGIYLWNNLPEKDRLQIERTVQSQPFLTFPLDRLAPGILTRLQTIMQNFGFRYMQSWRPNFDTFLSHCTLMVHTRRQPAGSASKPDGIHLSVYAPGDIDVFQAYLRGVPILDSQMPTQNLPAPVANR